uniref:RNase H type-1 domain-containing protein n=1 Tax=Gossypium raimondii TaxID=29730 RepID=A0A0D2N9P8_GOSRA|nr:hypothetical protein B456_001G145400 [Gossypium raimondii]
MIKAQLKKLDALNKLLHVTRVEIVRWRPSENAFIKVSFDGAFQAHSLKSKGVVLGSTTIINNHIQPRFAAEAIACLQVIQLGIDSGFQDVVIEGDSLMVIKKQQANKNDDSCISAYILFEKEI